MSATRQYYGQRSTKISPLERGVDREASQTTTNAKGAGLAFTGVAEKSLPRRVAEVTVSAKPIGMTFRGPDELVISRRGAEILTNAKPSGLAFLGVSERQIPRRVGEIGTFTKSSGLVFLQPTEKAIPRRTAEITVNPKPIGLVFNQATEKQITRHTSKIYANAKPGGLAFISLSEKQLTRRTAEITVSAKPTGLTFNSAAELQLLREAATIDATATPAGLVFLAPTNGESANFNGTNAYLYRPVTDYQKGEGTGALVLWMKSDTTIGFDQEQSLFCASDQETPRIEFGIRDNSGETELYIETDDGGPFGTTFWRVPISLNLFDGQWHMLAWMSDGDSYQVWVDGGIWFTGYGVDSGKWFGDVQSSSGNDFQMLSAGAFRRNGTVDQYYAGLLDEGFLTNRLLDASEITAIWNSGDGVKIPQIQSNYATIWADVQNAWEFDATGTKHYGDEYITQTADWFTAMNITPGEDGIPGIITP